MRSNNSACGAALPQAVRAATHHAASASGKRDLAPDKEYCKTMSEKIDVFGIGNAFRTVGSGVTANLEGSIDEVRISGIERGADDMLFTTAPVPEPSTTLLMGLGGLALILRRRK